jgi:hypothetical protein
MGQKPTRGQQHAKKKRKNMSPIGRLSEGTMGQEPTRGRIWAMKKKIMCPIGYLSIGVVGQKPTMGQEKKNEPIWVVIELTYSNLTQVKLVG